MEPEVGVIDAIPRRDGKPQPVIEVSQTRLNWEQKRPRVLTEMMAEALGIFICGIFLAIPDGVPVLTADFYQYTVEWQQARLYTSTTGTRSQAQFS
jgi:hypothetical protein